MSICLRSSFRALCTAVVATATLSFVPQSHAVGKLDEATVKAVIEKGAPGSVQPRFTWRSIEIASSRKASGGEIRAAGLPPGATIWPVRVDYTRQIGDGARDFKWNYYFYQDDFGGWAKQSNATSGNAESDLYYKKP